MRRQTRFGGLDPAWMAASVRLDPNVLPARIAANCDTQPVAVIEPKSVTLAPNAGGPFLQVPVGSYEGVVLAECASPGAGAGLVLMHDRADLSVPLCVANEQAGLDADLEADWHAWGDTLDKPLLFAEADGAVHAANGRLGALAVSRPRPRRANAFFAARRPAFLARRALGDMARVRVFQGEREIIAPE